MNLFLFHRSLRLEDNRGINRAFLDGDEVIPLFVFDTVQMINNKYRSDNAVQFMVNSLKEIDQKLLELGSQLNLCYGDTVSILEKIVVKYRVKAIYVNADYTPFARSRSAKIRDLSKKLGIKFVEVEDYLINSVDIMSGSGEPYKVFTPYYNKVREIQCDKPYTQLGKFVREKVNIDESTNFNVIDKLYRANKDIYLSGGRKEAVKMLQDDFKQYDEVFGSGLAPHFKFGTISVREFLSKVKNEKIVRQLHWRDFWAYITYHYPKVIQNNFYEKYDTIKWEFNEHSYKNWCEGKTGFPIIDAGMRELNATGFMNNRARMLVASFLVKNLFIDWRIGAQYFASKLIDYCPMQNQNNWQSVAGVGASALPWFRVMNPWLQQKKFFNSQYIKKWVPELKNLSFDEINDKKLLSLKYSINIDSYSSEVYLIKMKFMISSK